jgi:hypothetical protein
METRCLLVDHCCGTFTNVNDPSMKLESRCHDMMKPAYIDDLGNEWTHSCGAQKLIAAATAVIALSYLM